MNYINECLQRAENAKLSSDDHGHDTTALRLYCESELCDVYDTIVPELCARLKKAIKYIRDLDHCAYSKQVADELEAPIAHSSHSASQAKEPQ